MSALWCLAHRWRHQCSTQVVGKSIFKTTWIAGYAHSRQIWSLRFIKQGLCASDQRLWKPLGLCLKCFLSTRHSLFCDSLPACGINFHSLHRQIAESKVVCSEICCCSIPDWTKWSQGPRWTLCGKTLYIWHWKLTISQNRKIELYTT